MIPREVLERNSSIKGKLIMPTIFTKIVNREIPSHIVAENDEFLAFLDIRPIVKGHTLVIPKKEVDYLFDMEDDLMGRMMSFTKKVAHALKLATDCKRVGIAASGFEIPHTHLHLCPINTTPEMACTNPALQLSNEEMISIAHHIRENYVNLYGNSSLRSRSGD
jgi:histidine triad (HIT) family protein